jgi:hypothetical protein
MVRKRNECVDAAILALKEAGVFDPLVVPGAKHLQVRWPHGGGMRFYVLPSTPSDRRAPANTRAGIRKILKADGRIKEPAPVERPPPPRPPSLAERVEQLERELGELKAAMSGNGAVRQ